MIWFAGLAGVAAAVSAAVWWIRGRKQLDLGAALNAPWWLWPLMRISIYWWFQREGDKELDALCGWVDQEGNTTRRSWQYIRIDQHHGRYRVRVYVMRRFPKGDDEPDSRASRKMMVVNEARHSLALGPVNYEWKWRLVRNHVILTPKLQGPKKAPFRRVQARLEAHLTKHPTSPVQAIGEGRRLISVDMFKDDPHLGISAGTGGGKSAQIRSLMAQLLWANDDAIGIIADRKEFSQRGLADVPGVLYARSPEQINGVLVAVFAEIERRNHICANVGRGRLPRFPMIVLGLEEVNVTYTSLNTWWRHHPDYDGRLAPGIYALDQILCCGRQVRAHAIVEGQDVNKRVLSGAGAGTVNIGVWNLANYDTNTWSRHARGHEWMPPVPHGRQPGWCVTVNGSELAVGQRIWFTDGGDETRPAPFEAYDWLMSKDRSEAEHHIAELRAQLALPPVHPSTDHGGDSQRQGTVDGVQQVRQTGEEGERAHTPTLPHGDVVEQGLTDGREGNHATHQRSSQHGVAAPTDFAVRPWENVSMLGIRSGNGIGPDDRVTVQDAAKWDECPWPAETLSRYLRDPKRRPPVPVVPYDRGKNLPARWEPGMLRAWIVGQQRRESNPGYQPLVYCIVDGGEPGVSSAIAKVGMSFRFWERLDDFAGHPDEVMWVFHYESEDAMKAGEKWWHDRYNGQRVFEKREKFRIDGPVFTDLAHTRFVFWLSSFAVMRTGVLV